MKLRQTLKQALEEQVKNLKMHVNRSLVKKIKLALISLLTLVMVAASPISLSKIPYMQEHRGLMLGEL